MAIAFQDQGVPTYQAFCPTKKDRKRLSTRRSEVMTAETAYSEHRAANGSTAGTWGVTVAEAEGSGTPAYDDSSLRGVPRGHASLYFGGKSRGQMVTSAKLLVRTALRRGRCYPE